MDEHDRAGKRAAFVELVAEEKIVVVLQTHATENDDIDFGLQGDLREQLVVGFARHREDRQLLRLHQRVEDVDHRDAGADHVARDDALGRVYGRPADIDHVFLDDRATVARNAGAGEYAPEQVVREGYLHGFSQEAHFGIGSNAAASRKDLEEHIPAFQADHLRQRSAVHGLDLRQLAVGHPIGLHHNNVAGNLFDPVVDFILHNPKPPRSFWSFALQCF